MSNDLVKQLRNRADRWMKYDYEEHAKTDTEAADRIEFLERVLLKIANAVGDPSAYWIARVALDKTDD